MVEMVFEIFHPSSATISPLSQLKMRSDMISFSIRVSDSGDLTQLVDVVACPTPFAG
jgi:hypothetical protein